MALDNYLRDVKKRITEVRMLHIGLGDHRWLLMDEPGGCNGPIL